MDAIKNKFLLLDTNVIINSSKNGEEYGGFYNKLRELEVKPVFDLSIRFEFLRATRDKKDRERNEKFLDLLFGNGIQELPHDPKEMFDKAKDMAILYGRHSKPSIEFGDCLIAAQMCKYWDNLFLATENKDDFPRFLFERIHVHTIDVPKKDEIHNIGIYQFKKGEYDRLVGELY